MKTPTEEALRRKRDVVSEMSLMMMRAQNVFQAKITGKILKMGDMICLGTDKFERCVSLYPTAGILMQLPDEGDYEILGDFRDKDRGKLSKWPMALVLRDQLPSHLHACGIKANDTQLKYLIDKLTDTMSMTND